MLSNYLLNQQKIILIKDQYGIENTSHKIINKWINEQKGADAVPKLVDSLQEQDPFLLARISKLSRSRDPAELFKFIHRCRRDGSVQYLFLWATEKNISERFLVPYLEHMSELILTLEDDQHLSILVRKAGGSVSNKRYQYHLQSDGSFAVKEVKKSNQGKQDGSTEATTAERSIGTSVDPAKLGTFKIGDLKKDELEAKEALTLPFEFYKTTAEGGKVLYHPDAEDDLDEEDPDDDLLI